MFPEKTSDFYAKLISREGPSGPLGKMTRFSELELAARPEELSDPIGDAACQRCANGRLVHRYPSRALLLVTDRCAAHCRFCFRRARLSQAAPDISDAELGDALRYIAATPELEEIILSGGDPLSLSDSRLLEIVEALRGAGVRSLRLHTRYPVYDPARCASLGPLAGRLDAIVVQANHSGELTPEFVQAAKTLRNAKFLLNQSVLLRGVNDSAEELASLSRALSSAGVLPYYLHYLDLAPGISHFRVPLEKAAALVRELQGSLPGYLVPRLILDLPGGKGKIQLSSQNLRRGPDGLYLFESPLTGETVAYKELL